MNHKLKYLIPCILGGILAFTGCSTGPETIVDREGNTVEVPKKLERIISTAPSNTEILVGLGLADSLVAVDTYSTDIEGLNEEVTQLELSNPDAETIIALEPDLIITSGINKVGNAENPFAVLEEAGIPVVYIPTSDSIEGIYEDITFIADVTNTEKEGEEIVTQMKEKIDAIAAKAAEIKEPKQVYFEISPAPYLFTPGAGTYLNEMLDIVGAENIFGDETGWVSPSSEVVMTKNPDVILTNVGYVEAPLDEIKSRDGWDTIKAIQEDAVYLIDTNSSSRASQNIVIALEEIAKAIYPEYYE